MNNPYKFGDEVVSYHAEFDPISANYFTFKFSGKIIDVMGSVVKIYGKSDIDGDSLGIKVFHYKQCERVD